MGKIDNVGPNVIKLKPGDRVVASFKSPVEIVDTTKRSFRRFVNGLVIHRKYTFIRIISRVYVVNQTSLMNAMSGHRCAGFFGYLHLTASFTGGQTEYVRVSLGEVNLLPIPDHVTDEQAINLSGILPISHHAVVDTRIFGRGCSRNLGTSPWSMFIYLQQLIPLEGLGPIG